jgi:hypothetical protein
MFTFTVSETSCRETGASNAQTLGPGITADTSPFNSQSGEKKDCATAIQLRLPEVPGFTFLTSVVCVAQVTCTPALAAREWRERGTGMIDFFKAYILKYRTIPKLVQRLLLG